MSLITGCPACGTMFRVVPDQLKISEGWVRCGHCSEVFDATAHLQDAALVPAAEQADPAGAEAGTPQANGPGDPGHVAPADAAAVSRDASGDQPDAGGPDPDPGAPAPSPSPFPEPLEQDVHAPVAAREEAQDAAAARAGDAADGYGDLPLDAFRRESQADVLPDRISDVGDDAAEPALEDVSFVRDARRRAFWRRPGVRALLALVGIALLLLLAAQVAVHERDRLAAAQPALRPWIERLCEPLQCRIGPPRRIEALAIDSSGFTKLRPDAYRLSFTLKNNGAQPVALPALELTLTDAQDQPVLRRVLLPRELGAAADTLPAGGDWSAAVSLAIEASGAGSRIAGYRLLAFYP